MKMQTPMIFRYLQTRKTTPNKNYSINFSTEKINQLIVQMSLLMDQHRPFLRTRYTIKNLAEELHIQPYQLSALLNQYLGQNFNDYLNHYRVNFSKDLIHQGVSNSLNLKGLAEKCGFNNRNSFTTAFKKYTGQVPSFYIQLFKNQQKS